jgi:hypothetical protein
MSLRLFLLERHVPSAMRRRMFDQLVRVTADAFDTPPPHLGRLPSTEGIQRFAEFTRAEAERVLAAAPASSAVSDRLFHGAQEMGALVRRRLGIRRPDEAVRALRLLYAAIGIDLDREPRTGDVVIGRCAFSRVYTPAVCQFVSALDAGIVSGLTGGTAMIFTARITEGAPACRARLVKSARV